jgi:hypothetical protein
VVFPNYTYFWIGFLHVEKGRAARRLCQRQIPHYLGKNFSLVFIISSQ